MYSNYIKSQRLLELAKNFEDRNILERMLIANLNAGSMYTLADPMKLQQELLDKHSDMRIRDIREILEGDFEKVDFEKSDFKKSDFKKSEGRNGITLSVFSFSITIPVRRYQKLKSLGSDTDIMHAALFYACLLPGGQQWSIPLETYQNYGNKHSQSKIECFASPFNSNAIMCKPVQNRFCSICPYDDVFGSLGNFFTCEIPEDSLLIANPPFTESLLKQTAEKLLSLPNDFVMYGPEWQDAEFYQIMISANVEKKILYRNRYYYECSGKRVTAKFNSVVFTRFS
jgi:hypothetical protein